MIDWVRDHEALTWWLAASSGVMFLGSLLVIPWLVARIPADYFVRPEGKPSEFHSEHPVAVVALKILKNAAGLICFLAGIAMLVLPGQGILAMLTGIVLMSFPGKRKLELKLIRRPAVLKAVNWLRDRAGRAPLLVDRPDKSRTSPPVPLPEPCPPGSDNFTDTRLK